MTQQLNKSRRTARRAVAAVEFAIIAPVLVFLTGGMIELARGMMTKEVLTDAARKGCRSAILPTATNDGVKADVRAVLTGNSINADKATINVLVNDMEADVSTSVAGDKIAVRVSVSVADVAWITPFFLPGSSIASETVVMLSQKN